MFRVEMRRRTHVQGQMRDQRIGQHRHGSDDQDPRTSQNLGDGAMVGTIPPPTVPAAPPGLGSRSPTTASTACARCRNGGTSRWSSTPPAKARISTMTRFCGRRREGHRLLTLAAIGPSTIPAINGDANIDETNVIMVTCGGCMTIPMVYGAVKAPRSACDLGEIVASISSSPPVPAPAPTSTSSPRRRRRRSRCSAAPNTARRSSSSTSAEPLLIMRHGVHVEPGRRSRRDRGLSQMVATVQKSRARLPSGSRRSSSR